MAIHAVDLHGGSNLAIDVAVAMRILGEVAIHALHALLHMNGRHVHRLLELLRIIVADGLVVLVEQISAAVAFEHGSEVPAMAVIVRELSVMQRWIERAHALQEVRIIPESFRCRAFRIAFIDRPCRRVVRVALFRRPHRGRVRFVVPHGVSHEGIHEHIGLVHVTNHALAGGDRAGEAVLERMPGLVLVDRRIDGL